MRLCRVISLRSLLATETLGRLLSKYHILSDARQKIGLHISISNFMILWMPIVLTSCAVHFHFKFTALQFLRVYWVLTLRNIILVVQLRDVWFQAFYHLWPSYVVTDHHGLFVLLLAPCQ